MDDLSLHSTPQGIVKNCQEAGENLAASFQARGVDIKSNAGWLDFTFVKSEVQELTNLFNQLSFSDFYQSWSKSCRQRLVEELCGDDAFVQTAMNWKSADLDTKFSLLEKVATGVGRIFSRDSSLFTPRSTNIILQDKEGDQAYVLRGRTKPKLAYWAADIFMNSSKEAGFDDFYIALNTIFHESLHVVHLSLAWSYSKYAHLKEHPLKEDVYMLSQSRPLHGGLFERIRPLYHALPEERDSHQQSKAFVNAMRARLHKYNKVNALTHHAALK